MTHINDSRSVPLVETAAATHERARAALASPHRSMDAVVWLSAHLTAMEHVVYPSARALLPRDRQALDTQRRLTRRMQGVLRQLEQLWTGDALAQHDSGDRLRCELEVLMAEHERLEHDLLSRLEASGTHETGVDLADRYHRAIGRGPTRPHPHGPRQGRLGRLVYTFDAARDHLLDVLDSRHVPLPRTSRPRRPLGRWGSYLLGQVDVPDQSPTERSTQHSDQRAPRRQP